jgi:hypothetical protein
MIIKDEISACQNDIQIKKELIEKLQRQEKIQQFLVDHFYEAIFMLKTLIPIHDRTSCCDANTINKGRCNRCTILNMEADGMWDSDYIVTVSLEKVMNRE